MTNHELRRQALEGLRRHPLRLIGLTALLAVPFILAALWVALVYGLMLFNDLFVLYTDAAGAVRLGVTHGLTYGMLIPYITGMSGGVFFVGIVSQGLLAGYMHCLLACVRGEKPTVRTLLGRLDTCLKMLGLEALAALKAFLRVIPLVLTGVLIDRFDPSASGGLSQLALVFVPLAVMIWLARLVFSHALAGYAIADTPEIRIRGAIARSKAAMKGRMWRYFGLHAPYLLVTWAVTAAAGALVSVMPASETAVSLMAAVLYAVPALLANQASAGFYEDQCRPAVAVKEVAGETVPAEDMAPAVDAAEESEE